MTSVASKTTIKENWSDTTCSNGAEAAGSVNPEDSTRRENTSTSSRYSNPVYKLISFTNGQVNKMTKDEMKAKLKEHRLDTRGVKEVLKKRLKHFYQRQKLQRARIPEDEKMADYLLVIDYEATCDENKHNYPHEIIEFPAVLICTKKHIVVDEFQEYCKPRMNPILTSFCTALTGISQDLVDNADYFPDVLRHMESWMTSHNLGTEKSFYVVTDGPWDMSRFLHSQCNFCGIPFPAWARKWVNIRKAYRNYYGFRNSKLIVMLENLGMEFEGSQHRGIDDSRNIGRVATRLLGDGAVLYPNEKMFAKHLKANKKICIEVVSCTREGVERETGEVDWSEDDELDSSDICYSYQGRAVTFGSKQNGEGKEGGVNGEGEGDKGGVDSSGRSNKDEEGAEEDKGEVDDVEDLKYWMSLKGKKL